MTIKKIQHSVFSTLLPLGMVVGSLCLTSCEETTEVDEYANWKERNMEFIDSIANVAETNADGKWLKILSFKLDSLDKDGILVEHDTEDYVYCHIEESGTATGNPLHTDIVSVNYRGRLMPTLSCPEGEVFDESYKGVFNPALNVPRRFSLDDLVVGWSTALMHMVKGDTWRVYIPAEMGYGSSRKNDIPAWSALVFDINLVDFSSAEDE